MNPDRIAAMETLEIDGTIDDESDAVNALFWMRSLPYMQSHKDGIDGIIRAMQANIEQVIDGQTEIERRQRLSEEYEDAVFARTRRAGPGGI